MLGSLAACAFTTVFFTAYLGVNGSGPAEYAASASCLDSYDLYRAPGNPWICFSATVHVLYTPGEWPTHTTYHLGFLAEDMARR